MRLRSRYCTHPGDAPGYYAFFAACPGREWEEVHDPEIVRAWALGFESWIIDTREHMARAKEGRPRLIDWRAPLTEMRAHLEKLQREKRTADRPLLFRRPLTAEEIAA
jgi:hypothetical protein